ncbi:MAG: RNA-binding transcriptional accessory protein [Francisellaceae bacterium]|jgi:protein Tex|nr:RNA-binding transcriptional accessory protein [Francisellaceae bacterium]MBT6207722.1 RNA-binding transcriptional accessory protein [Francisellaceae bacterium]MBT6538755.1 RNA-binding transcriptional accessory protein [Francisellaceae bacterium]
MLDIAVVIAKEIKTQTENVNAAISLLDQDNTVPFIARYRKEKTGGLDDIQLRTLDERLDYLRDLESRKESILKSIEEQGKLTPELVKLIGPILIKSELEDIYRPFKPKRVTKGQLAITAGLEPLANSLFTDPNLEPSEEAIKYINVELGIKDVKSALDGAKFILMERFADITELYTELKSHIWKYGLLKSDVAEGKKDSGKKFSDYFDFAELLIDMPSHRILAVFRGRSESALNVKIILKEENNTLLSIISQHVNLVNESRAADKWLQEVVKWTWKIKLEHQIEHDVFSALKEKAEEQAIDVFSDNVKTLLMASPAGDKVTLGLDPGLRTGVKVAIVDKTGKIIYTETIYPHPPQKQWSQALSLLALICEKHKVELVAIGNGTGSRETDLLVQELINENDNIKLEKVMVSEAGASIYSASAAASLELPDIDVSIRGAISIARRLQDPLAELVKIDPKAIGVGQYQHDVNQVRLKKRLDNVIEDCVNSVGVDLNTASVPLLKRVAGLSEGVSKNIVNYRDVHGKYINRKQLLQVDKFGGKTFEQAAGFLRIRDGDNKLDSSAVHPESYSIVTNIATSLSIETDNLVANESLVNKIDSKKFVTETAGLITINDILEELKKPGRDPRPEFKTIKFKDGVNKISDLEVGMVLDGVITNVTNFGAFVDVGVHQDGLVHVSQISSSFVSNPRDILKVGGFVKAKIIELDLQRKRINFSLKLNDETHDKPKGKHKKTHPKDADNSVRHNNKNKRKEPKKPKSISVGSNAMAEALQKALLAT